MQIPQTVRASVVLRFDCLDRIGRDTIMRASAIGFRFDIDLLVATARTPDARVRIALENALDLQLIIAEDESKGHYAFRHALTRDIIYAELVAAKSRRLHLRIGDTLERRSFTESSVLPDLAHHYWLAGDRQRASRFNELAGDRAVAIHAPTDARTYYGRAQSMLAPASPEHARVARKLKALNARP